MVFARQRSAGHFYSSQDWKQRIRYSAGDFAARRDPSFRKLNEKRALRFFPRRAGAASAAITHGGSTTTRVVLEDSSGGKRARSIPRAAGRMQPSPTTGSRRYRSAL